MEEKEVLKYLGIDENFLEFLQKLFKLKRSELFNRLVAADTETLDKIVVVAEKASSFGYADQEVFFSWQIKRLITISLACDEILLEKAIKSYVPGG